VSAVLRPDIAWPAQRLVHAPALFCSSAARPGGPAREAG